MKKVIVIGCPGAGKSTFSLKLKEKTGLPLYHLDQLNWLPDTTTVAREVFQARQEEVLGQDRWIIDGNYGSTYELRMAACDTIIFFDYPEEVCVEGLYNRVGKTRADMPWVEESVDEELLAFVKDFRTQVRPTIFNLLSIYQDKNIFIFTSRKEANDYLKKLKKP
ncbi:adenylate kinase [Streptococcus suis]|nr:adenylate kinase [Streptococcus suis]